MRDGCESQSRNKSDCQQQECYPKNPDLDDWPDASRDEQVGCGARNFAVRTIGAFSPWRYVTAVGPANLASTIPFIGAVRIGWAFTGPGESERRLLSRSLVLRVTKSRLRRIDGTVAGCCSKSRGSSGRLDDLELDLLGRDRGIKEYKRQDGASNDKGQSDELQ